MAPPARRPRPAHVVGHDWGAGVAIWAERDEYVGLELAAAGTRAAQDVVIIDLLAIQLAPTEAEPRDRETVISVRRALRASVEIGIVALAVRRRDLSEARERLVR